MRHGVYLKSRNALFPSPLSKTSAFFNTDFVSIMQKWQRNIQAGTEPPQPAQQWGCAGEFPPCWRRGQRQVTCF